MITIGDFSYNGLPKLLSDWTYILEPKTVGNLVMMTIITCRFEEKEVLGDTPSFLRKISPISSIHGDTIIGEAGVPLWVSAVYSTLLRTKLRLPATISWGAYNVEQLEQLPVTIRKSFLAHGFTDPGEFVKGVMDDVYEYHTHPLDHVPARAEFLKPRESHHSFESEPVPVDLTVTPVPPEVHIHESSYDERGNVARPAMTVHMGNQEDNQ
jgi:hypothetical protein